MSQFQSVNFYQKFGLDPADKCEELAIILAGRDALFDQYGVSEDKPERKEILLAYGILSKQENRKLYDEAVVKQRPLNNFELEHLANFGSWPQLPGESERQPHAQAQPQAKTQSQQPFARGAAPFKEPNSAEPIVNPFQVPSINPQQAADLPSNFYGATAVPVNQYAIDPEISRRPSVGVRMGIATLDTVIAFFAAFPIAAVASGISDSAVVAIFMLVPVLYFIGFEFLTGATPMKHAFGYTVRDVNTKGRLTAKQVAVRNWWRIVSLVPFAGWLASSVAALAYAASITPNNDYRAAHDRLAGAEVTRKPNF